MLRVYLCGPTPLRGSNILPVLCVDVLVLLYFPSLATQKTNKQKIAEEKYDWDSLSFRKDRSGCYTFFYIQVQYQHKKSKFTLLDCASLQSLHKHDVGLSSADSNSSTYVLYVLLYNSYSRRLNAAE